MPFCFIMIKNYFYFYRFLIENRPVFLNSVITDLFTQAKDRLFAAIPVSDLPDRHLIIDTNPNLPFLLVKKEHKKAKKNTKDFLMNLLPSEIKNIQIANDDRIIKITTNKFDIYFTIKGPKTNVYFIIGDEIQSFKNVKDRNVLSFLTDRKYIEPAEQYEINGGGFKRIEELQAAFPFFNKLIVGEYYIRTNPAKESIDKQILSAILTEIFFSPIAIAERDNRIIFAPSDWQLIKESKIVKTFNDINSAVEFYLAYYYRHSEVLKLKKELNRLLEKRTEQISQKLNKLKFRIDGGSKESVYRNYADLLQINRHLISKGEAQVELENFDGEKIKIKLDPAKSLQGNIDYYYEKARDEKISFEKSTELYSTALKEYENILNLKNELQSTDDLNKLKKIKSALVKGNLKVKMGNQKIKFRHFLIDRKFHLFVGRESKENDELTFKYAKQNDYWFHARGYSGSHVVLKAEGKNNAIPKSVIKTAASVAAYYSKAKTASLAPVSFTFRKFVHKKKGMPPGQVVLQREKTILVKPEIPVNCVRVFED